MTLNVLTRIYKHQDNLFTFNLKYLFFVGLWPTEDLTPTQRMLYKIYETTLSVLSLTLIIITGIGMYNIKGDITTLFANFDKTLVGYNFFLKAMIFIIKRDKMRILIRQIENSGDTISDERKELMAKYVIFITVLSLFIVGAFTGKAILDGEMVIEAWMPFNPYESSLNLMTASQIVGVLFVPCTMRAFAMKGLVCSLIMYLCDQLVEVQENLKALRYSEERETEMRRKLKKIIRKHIRLMSYSKSMEMFFKEYFLIQNLAVSVELCLNAIMMTLAGIEQITLLITLLVYLLVALLNAYVYCYLGNELIIKSEGVSLAAYESTWLSWPVDIQKDLIIVIMASQKAFKLSAGGMAFMSIQTFAQILYNGYSIFAVLNDAIH